MSLVLNNWAQVFKNTYFTNSKTPVADRNKLAEFGMEPDAYL